jgi:DNA repair ATPase RecN
MKKIFVLFLLLSNFCFAQSDEAKQLLLNVEKLAQFKKILQNMKDGYQVLYKGYTSIKHISEGNFSLHKTFLDGLLEVSPAVKRYQRVAAIIQYQLKIVQEYKAAFLQFKESKQFTATEIDYIGKVYSNLFNQSIRNMDELAMVITSGKLRMSDDERLNAIDKIYDEVMDQYTFLNEFNNNTAILSLQREKDKMDIDLMKKVHGLR